MAKLAGYIGSSLQRYGRQIVLNVGGSVGIYSSTISAAATFDESSAMVSAINGGAADRNVTALASCEVVGMVKAFYNSGSTNNLVIQKADTTTLATLKPGDWVVIFHNGTTWIVWSTVAAVNALATILATANTWTAAQAFSAAVTSTSTMTTTGGVSGGTPRKIGGPVHIKQGTSTCTNTTAETDLATHTLEASTIGLGTLVEITGTTRVTSHTGTPTLNIQVYMGSTVLSSTGAVAQITGDQYQFTFRMVGQAAAGASVTVSKNGTLTAKISGTTATSVQSATVSAVPTNATLTCRVTATWNAASTSNIVLCDDFVVRVVG
jgi:hypothetical protein